MTRPGITKATATGLSRFGLGARPGGLAALGNDLRGALLQEAAARTVAMPGGDNVVPSVEAYHRFRVETEQIKAMKLAAAQPNNKPPVPPAANMEAANGGGEALKEAGAAANPDPKAKNDGDPKALRREVVRELFQAEMLGRLQAARDAQTGFAERLVLFWSNHFCVSVRKAGVLRVLAGPYEREAIRPHVLGRFADMLLAVEKHPAMLVYLDNEQSIGPNSKGGQRTQKGLNENLAREIMELHTLGVDGGYTQEDVTSLARILTGWRFARKDNTAAEEGHFAFQANLHEPGEQKLLGVAYRENGASQGEDALLTLARHPSTARHIAHKLAVHFVSDTPDPVLVGRLEKTFHDSEGDLAAVSRTLIELPEAWGAEPAKLRTPYEFLAASVRVTGVTMQAPQINGALMSMGQPLWSPPGPNGFPDVTAAWASPEGMKARLDFAARFAQSIPGDTKPSDVLDDVLGPIVSSDTRTAVARAESRAQGFALLLMSPEFQRR